MIKQYEIDFIYKFSFFSFKNFLLETIRTMYQFTKILKMTKSNVEDTHEVNYDGNLFLHP